MKQLILATHNQGKVDELRQIFADEGIDVELLSAADAGLNDVEETGTTFAENALLKAHAAVAQSGLGAIADDSGLAVDALDGSPGIFSARFASQRGITVSDGQHRDDVNISTLLEELAGHPEPWTAAFVCAAVLVTADGDPHVVEATMPGRVIGTRRGDNGFGYDPVFVPDGETRTNAELSPGEKHAISHRGKAFRALLPSIRTAAKD